jgi:hypothetical protein
MHIPNGTIGLFVSGPRFFASCLNDTLTAASQLGTDNMLFVTCTFDHAWGWATQLGLTGGMPLGSDAVACTRIFEMVRRQIQLALKNGEYTPCGEDGQCVHADYYVDVNEWQKRGTPHNHGVYHFPGEIWSAAQACTRT